MKKGQDAGQHKPRQSDLRYRQYFNADRAYNGLGEANMSWWHDALLPDQTMLPPTPPPPHRELLEEPPED